jgi:gas vesicle protein
MGTYTEAHNGNGAGTFFKGLVLGGLAGAGLAILFAPRSGQETRDLIAHKSDELRGRVAETASETRAQINGFAQRARLQAEEIVGEAKEGAATLQERGREYVRDRKARLERTANAAKAAVQENWNEAA